ncbi:hypothetical protein ALNOE001_00750 [Candidatus Methanobinarius endosymbioticus]|uniref:PKD domain-containing protein n=1 Tax=Candidatus Methanobinarius endosymbioticus TaxID=2006182 RepID=A0A366MG50_9EURY|nr:hypothetical protein ALNOE001_00750 [Candidatus Methanobinarius endosymbioticus]
MTFVSGYYQDDAIQGGCIYFYGWDGANNGEINIINCSFINNTKNYRFTQPGTYSITAKVVESSAFLASSASTTT